MLLTLASVWRDDAVFQQQLAAVAAAAAAVDADAA